MANNLPGNAGDTRDIGLIPGSERSSGGGKPTPVFLLGKSHGQRRLAGYCSWYYKETRLSDRIHLNIKTATSASISGSQ